MSSNVDESEIDQVVSNLSEDQRTIMGDLERVRKSDSNTFHENQLQRRLPCWKINVPKVLKQLANMGLVNRSNKKGFWRTTKRGRKVEHRVQNERMKRRYPFPVERRRFSDGL